MYWYKVLYTIGICFITASAFVTGTIESTPVRTDGVLTTCAGNQISITCTHSNLESGHTRWNFSFPINCVVDVAHADPSSTEPCGPFTFQDITPLAPDVILSSTAVAIATTSMTGTTVECRDSPGLKYTIIGPITLCVVGDILSLSVTDTIGGVLIEWQLTTNEYCQRNINYTVIIHTADHLSSNSTVVTTFGVTSTTVSGLIPNQMYTVQVRTAVASSCDDITATRNFTTSGELTGVTVNSNNRTDGNQSSQVWAVPVAVCIVLIIIIAVIVIVVIVTVVVIKKHGRKDNNKTATVQVEFQKRSGTTELIYAKVQSNSRCQTQQKPKMSEDEHRVQYSEIQRQDAGLSYASVVFPPSKKGGQHNKLNTGNPQAHPKEAAKKTFRSRDKEEQFESVVYSKVNIQKQTSTGESNEANLNQGIPTAADQDVTSESHQSKTASAGIMYASVTSFHN